MRLCVWKSKTNRVRPYRGDPLKSKKISLKVCLWIFFPVVLQLIPGTKSTEKVFGLRLPRTRWRGVPINERLFLNVANTYLSYLPIILDIRCLIKILNLIYKDDSIRIENEVASTENRIEGLEMAVILKLDKIKNYYEVWEN